MAIYHFSAKVVSRANGSSAVASAAYRSGSELFDERLGRHHDFSNKADVIHSEVLLPEGAPQRLNDRATLWNEVEAGEKRKDAQLAREIEFSIPREMNREDGVRLARDFVQREFVDRGMVADLNVHWDRAEDGSPKPHAHVMLAMREVSRQGFGKKERDWNRGELLQHWREAWGAHVNERLTELGIDARIDHRSYVDQGIALEPQNKIGPAASRRPEQGLEAERIEDHTRIARENGEKIIAAPRVALDAITRTQATFTNRDLAVFAFRHSDGKEQYDRVMAAAKAAPELVALGKDGRGDERFTSREMIATEARLEQAADRLADGRHHFVGASHVHSALDAAEGRGLTLSQEQRDALGRITERDGLASVIGYAGTGKSAMLGIARQAWEDAGYTVRGAALSGIAAENLEGGSGIQSRTIASLEHAWSKDRDQLGPKDVLVVDEAGMIGTRQMERLLSAADQAGAKVVLVGDPSSCRRSKPVRPFVRFLKRTARPRLPRYAGSGRTGSATRRAGLPPAGRQRRSRPIATMAWCRRRTRAWLRGRGWWRVGSAAPGRAGAVPHHPHAHQCRGAQPQRRGARAAAASGDLGQNVAVQAERGERQFASGDRIMFLRNERSMGVKNGTLGTVEQVSADRMGVRLDDGRQVGFDVKDYAAVDHGYAATIHKSQGVTVDRVDVLATPGLDRHAAYVALSRHRDGVQLHYGRDDFASDAKLAAVLSRDRAKDMAARLCGRARRSRSCFRGQTRDQVARARARDRAGGGDESPRHVRRVPAEGTGGRASFSA